MKKMFLITSFSFIIFILSMPKDSFPQNLGIGTTTPAFKLDVKGGSINTDSVYRLGGKIVLSAPGTNIFVGINSGLLNTSGYNNSSTGYNALHDNTTGYSNTANGMMALNRNTTGQQNTASGYQALYSNTIGSYNTANGANALYFNTTGTNNAASGMESLYFNTSGNANTANGFRALYFNSSGGANTASGFQSLYFNTTGSYNTSTGENALLSNTTGSYNVATGKDALYFSTTGNSNAAVGYAALIMNSIGNQNTAAGYNALRNTTTADGNTALGFQAGYLRNNGYYNTFLGSGADASASGIFNSVAIGNISTVTAALQIRVGNSLMTSIGGYQNWSNVSDGRYKKDVKEDVKGIDFIMKLRPVTYHLDISGISKKLNETRGNEMNQLMKASIVEKEQIVFSGFVAQEVERAAKEAGYDFSGVDKPKNENDLYSLRYAEFVVPLVKAVQEQQQTIKQQQSQINELVKKIEVLEKNQRNP